MRHIRYRLFIVHFVLLILLFCPAQSLATAQTIYYTDFEQGMPVGWTPDNGIWQVGMPGPPGPAAAFQGSQCAGTVLTGNYPTFNDSRLITSKIVLPSLQGQSIYLSFWQWFQYAGAGNFGSNPSYGDVEVSTGTQSGPWTQVSRNISGNSGGWSFCAVDLSHYAGQAIYIAFHHNGGVNTAAGWYVDQVGVSLVPDWSPNQTETFEQGLPPGWFADNGIWQVGAPGSPGPDSAHEGSQCAGTVLTDNQHGYPTFNDSRLVSPAVTLPSVPADESIYLSFWQWFQYAGAGNFGSNPSYGDVEVSQWDATNLVWSNWTPVSRNISGNGGGWGTASIDLSAYASQRIRIAFHHNGGVNTAAGWYVDQVTILLPPPYFVPPQFTPGAGWAGDSINITGKWFTGATAVQFNGTPCSFEVITDTHITAIVPQGATTGPITVITPGGTGTSAANFTVLTGKVNTLLLVANAATGTVGQPATLRAFLRRYPDGFPLSGKTINFTVNGSPAGSAVTDGTGMAYLSYPVPDNLGSNSVPFKASFDGDSHYNHSNSNTGTLTIQKANVYLVVGSAKGKGGQTVALHALLRRIPDAFPLSGKTVTFSVDGSVVGTAVTDSKGLASYNYTIPTGTSVGDHTITASFAGDATAYNPSTSKPGTLTVQKSDVYLVVGSATGKGGQTVSLRALLRRIPDAFPLSGKTVTFSVDGTDVGTAVTGSNGLASYSYTIPTGTATGSHTITASFAGDSDYNAVSGTNTLTVNP